jgi:hypothetical protein
MVTIDLGRNDQEGDDSRELSDDQYRARHGEDHPDHQHRYGCDADPDLAHRKALRLGTDVLSRDPSRSYLGTHSCMFGLSGGRDEQRKRISGLMARWNC